LIAIIDYGMGNLASVKNALNKLGYEASITSHTDDILAADKVIRAGGLELLQIPLRICAGTDWTR